MHGLRAVGEAAPGPACLGGALRSPLSLCLLQDKEPRGIIPLENLGIREVEDSKKPVSVSGEQFGGTGGVKRRG